MPTFFYTAIESSSGHELSGTIESGSADEASATLKRKRFALTSLALTGVPTTEVPTMRKAPVRAKSHASGTASIPAKATSGWKRWSGRAITTKALTVFTRQLAALVKAGMPLLRCLEVLQRQERHPVFRAVLEDLAETIRSGGTLSEGLGRHPKNFDRLYVNMIKAGEAGGVLDTVLDRLARFMEKAERVKGQVKSAMMYPAIVMLLAVGIVAALMVFVVPKFEQIFSGLLKGQPLPALTRIVLGISAFVQHHVLVCVVAAAVLHVVLAAVKRTRVGIRARDWLSLRLPVVGDLALKSAVARFSRTFGTLLASGVPILQALTVTRETSGNSYVTSAIDLVHDRVKEGDSVARPLQATALFPAMVTSMIEVGEETGALPEMLSRIAETYDEEVDNAVTALTTIIEPLMIVMLAGVVGTIVIALFLPIVSIIQHLH